MPRPRRSQPEPLTTDLVTEFVAMEKTIAASEIEWKNPGGVADILRWRAPLESDGVGVGEICLHANTAIPRSWNFHIALRGHNVLGWHFSPGTRHKNWVACNADFELSTRVRSPHEQVWVLGPGFKCARPLTGLDSVEHEEALRRFCARAKVVLSAEYHAPAIGEQLTLFSEVAE
jgi:hypothetical protein